MFYYLNGTVAEILPYLAVVDCGGVGYACKTTNTTLAALKKGQRGKLYTYLNVGEGVFELYGFATQAELNSFKLLIGVSGVGPKAALAILSVVSPDQFTLAVMTQDIKTLTMAAGVGKKLAQRVLLELKDKIAGSQLELNGADIADMQPALRGGKTAEATAALASLGYSQAEIGAALKGIDVEALRVEDIVRQALRAMVSK